MSKEADRRIELFVSHLLRAGVIVSGAVVVFGGVLFLLRHHAEPAVFSHFQPEAPQDRSLHPIWTGALHGRARSIIELGALLLIATPILRVMACLAGFTAENDRRYILITAVVLAILLFSLMTGAAGF